MAECVLVMIDRGDGTVFVTKPAEVEVLVYQMDRSNIELLANCQAGQVLDEFAGGVRSWAEAQMSKKGTG